MLPGIFLNMLKGYRKGTVMNKNISEKQLFEQALSAKKEGNNQESMNYVQKILEQNAENADALNLAGIIYYEQEKLEKAKNSFAAAIQNDHTMVDAQHNYAETLIELEDYKNGVKAFVTILENHPENVTALLRLAQLSAEAGRFDDSVEYCEKVLEIEPENEQAREIINLLPKLRTRQDFLDGNKEQEDELYKKAILAHKNKDNNQAFIHINELLANNPNYAAAYNLAGKIFYESGKIENAKKSFIAAVNCAQDFVDAKHNLAITYYEMEEYQNCQEIYEDIIENHPGDKTALIQLAELNSHLGNQDKAHEYAKNILEKEPNNQRAKEIAGIDN